MFVAYAVIAVLLALALLVSATAKLRRVPQLGASTAALILGAIFS